MANRKKKKSMGKVIGKTKITATLLKAAKINGGIPVTRTKLKDGSYRVQLATQNGKQSGSSNKKSDSKRSAKKPGLRLSRNGNLYYETRANRSDKDFKSKV